MLSLTGPARRVLALGGAASPCKSLCTSSLRVRPRSCLARQICNLTSLCISLHISSHSEGDLCMGCLSLVQGTSFQPFRQQRISQQAPFGRARKFGAAIGPGGDFSAKGYSAAEAAEYEDMGGSVSLRKNCHFCCSQQCNFRCIRGTDDVCMLLALLQGDCTTCCELV